MWEFLLLSSGSKACQFDSFCTSLVPAINMGVSFFFVVSRLVVDCPGDAFCKALCVLIVGGYN